MHLLRCLVTTLMCRACHRMRWQWPRRESVELSSVVTCTRQLSRQRTVTVCLIVPPLAYQSGATLSGRWNRRWVTLSKKSVGIFVERTVHCPASTVSTLRTVC